MRVTAQAWWSVPAIGNGIGITAPMDRICANDGKGFAISSALPPLNRLSIASSDTVCSGVFIIIFLSFVYFFLSDAKM
jgi:hypothetical protein